MSAPRRLYQTRLDRVFLSMEVEDIESQLGLLYEAQMPNITGIPTYHLNPKTGKIQVLIAVHGNWVDTVPLKEVQDSLKGEAEQIVSLLKFHLREVSDSDVEVTFTKITNLKKHEIVNNFAEYKNGELTIKR